MANDNKNRFLAAVKKCRGSKDYRACMRINLRKKK